MNFIFINPPLNIAENNIWSIINSKTPPFGLALLSAILDQQGHTSQIIDADALELTIQEIIAQVSPAADFVGITATTVEISIASAIAEKIRENFPNIKIIMGGVHPTVFHKELVRDNFCDFVVRNEGEIPIIELARATPYELIPNLTWRNSANEVIVNPDSEKYVDLDMLPFPAYGKLPMHLYHSALGAATHQPSIGMITSRGCPGKCTFCFSGMFGTKIRTMSPARIIQHIDYLQKNYGIKEISFYDDTFTVDKQRITELCRLIIELKIKFTWSCFARVDTVTSDLLILMKKAGCHQIMYGFETPDEKILNNINKRTDLEQFNNVLSWMKAAKIDVRGAFMLGNPGETAASMSKTINYAKKSAIQFALFNITTPYPGTAMYNEFMQKNLLRHQNWDLYNAAQPVLMLNTVSDEEITKYYYKSYRDFYLRPAFILRHILTIRSFSQFSTYTKAALKISALLLKNILRDKN